MENQTYVILNEKDSSLVNLIIWDGDLTKWTPPDGTIAVLASNIDLNILQSQAQ